MKSKTTGLAALAALAALPVLPAKSAQPPARKNGRIAFTRFDPISRLDSIWTMKSDGSHKRTLVDGVGDPLYSPAWSPDGKTLAFVRDLSAGEGEMYTVNADGSGLTDVGGFSDAGGPNWSPDGRSIAWSDYDGDQVDVVIANLDTHQARAVAATDDDEGFDAWSPDGTKLAFERDHSEVTYPGPQDGIWVVNTDGSNPRQLRHSGRVMDWSPDGKRLLFVDWDAAANNYELYTMRPDGGRVKRLTSNPLDDGWASYSPDGKKIAFSRGQGGHEDDIYVMGADGKGEKRLTTAPGEDLFPQWSPDGKKILFRSRRSGPSAGLYTMRADGSHERYLGQEGWNAAWQPIPR